MSLGSVFKNVMSLSTPNWTCLTRESRVCIPLSIEQASQWAYVHNAKEKSTWLLFPFYYRIFVRLNNQRVYLINYGSLPNRTFRDEHITCKSLYTYICMGRLTGIYVIRLTYLPLHIFSSNISFFLQTVVSRYLNVSLINQQRVLCPYSPL